MLLFIFSYLYFTLYCCCYVTVEDRSLRLFSLVYSGTMRCIKVTLNRTWIIHPDGKMGSAERRASSSPSPGRPADGGRPAGGPRWCWACHGARSYCGSCRRSTQPETGPARPSDQVPGRPPADTAEGGGIMGNGAEETSTEQRWAEQGRTRRGPAHVPAAIRVEPRDLGLWVGLLRLALDHYITRGEYFFKGAKWNRCTVLPFNDHDASSEMKETWKQCEWQYVLFWDSRSV